MAGPPPDYVDVAERIRMFYERYPDGALQSWAEPRLFCVGDKTYIAYGAAAFRNPDDAHPGVGWAWEPVPGPTPFTKDSELQNAETSAWGRAIVALGFETKHIASADEVRNRSGEGSGRATASSTAAEGTGGAHTRPETESGRTGRQRQPSSESGAVRPDENPLEPTALQHAKLNAMLAELEEKDPNPDGTTWLQKCKDYVTENYGKKSRTELTRVEMTELIDTIQRWGYEKGLPF